MLLFNFHLFSIASESFYYGILLAAVTVIILYFILQMISKSCVKTIHFYISFAVLLVLLAIQDIFLIGAFKALDLVDVVRIYIQQQIGAYSHAMNMQDTQDILDEVIREMPLIGIFANITDMEVDNAQDLAEIFAISLQTHLKTYIWKRIGWCTAFIITAVLITFLADKRKAQTYSTARNRRQDAAFNRSNVHSRRSRGRHRF